MKKTVIISAIVLSVIGYASARSIITLITQAEQRRTAKLKWFQPYRTDGEQLRHPRSFLFGAFDNDTRAGFRSILTLEDSLRTALPLIHIYTAWGSKPEEEFPAAQVRSIVSMGSVPVITWEPWLTDFDAAQHLDLPDLASRDKGGLADIAAGKYDFYISRWADGAHAVNSQIFLRVGHEMNDPQRYPWGAQNNSARDFVAAWRHIHDVFRRRNVTNVIWVWSPHPAYGYFDAYYPGDDQVDYVGSSCLNYGAVASWSRWWTFQDIFGKHYKELEHFKKPIMITEFGSLATGGSRSKWYADALDQFPQRFPAVKAMIFFHYSDDKTTVQQGLNWYIRNDVPVTRAIVTAVQRWQK